MGNKKARGLVYGKIVKFQINKTKWPGSDRSPQPDPYKGVASVFIKQYPLSKYEGSVVEKATNYRMELMEESSDEWKRKMIQESEHKHHILNDFRVVEGCVCVL